MATKKTTPEKPGKAVPANEKSVKSTKPVKPAEKKAVPVAASKTETVSKKPVAARGAVAPDGKAHKKATPEIAVPEVKAGKNIQKPSDTVKEKTTPATAASKPEAPAKKKTAAKAEESAPKAEPKAVKIPKTTATGKVPYEPDFTHSVLDAPRDEPQQQMPALRYSDAELGEFKSLIQRKLDAAKKELIYLQGLITRKDAMGGDNDDGRYMTMEDGSLSMEREQLSQMASRQITFIDHLEKALMRIENKTYGVCRVTGKLIDKARLKAVPHATLSMEAKTSKTRVI
jgi:RNA polymerase-binding transcription factor DksA